MKRLISLLLAVIFVFSCAGCGGEKAVVSEEASAKAQIEFSEDEIYTAFEEALDFYYGWIYGQAYAEDMFLNVNNVFRARIEDGHFEKAEDLKMAIKSYFEEELAEQYINALNPMDEADGIYISVVEGVGDNGESIIDHSFEKLSDDNYLLVLTIESFWDEGAVQTRIVTCYYNGENWIFGNYGEGGNNQFDECAAGVPYIYY